MSSFALKVICKESPITPAGEVVWVVQGEYGWTSSHWGPETLSNMVVFATREAAEEAAAKWEGHPWYYAPERVEVVEVTAEYKQVLKGWRLI